MEEERDVAAYFPRAEAMILLREGKETALAKKERLLVSGALARMCEKAVQMPAFGVSLDELTRREMKEGVWLRLAYKEKQICRGMDFTELAFRVEPEYGGFNLCRLSGGAYEGRCYYLDLCGENMSGLYEVLTNL